ncbi:OmpA family protein [Bradyrhizobium sp. CCBAU 53351]|jgi:outer membrane protein OmpA-like peptidoglycan-associated protein|nr:OmpA family protein [Bradyrhizobium sp. CCBAU 53351]
MPQAAFSGGLIAEIFEPRELAAQEGLVMKSVAKGLTAILSVITLAVTLGAALSLPASSAYAGEESNSKNVTEDDIVRALAPAQKKPLTRGLSIAPQADPAPNAAETKLIQSVRGRSTRSLSSTEREEIASVAKDKPNIDLEITFDYNSANISAKSMPSVQALGRALTSPDLKGSTFVVAGHTDAAGGEAYNQDLSERRADAIKRYLVDKYSISATDLVTVGYGKSKLKDPSQPMAEANRRVQVVNMENKTTASK